MDQSLWLKMLTQVPQGQNQPNFGPSLASNSYVPSPLSNESMMAMNAPMRDGGMPQPQSPIRGASLRAPQAVQGAITEMPMPEKSPFEKLLEQRMGATEGLQSEMDDLKANPTQKTFKDLNLSPLMSWADGLGQTRNAQNYQAPKVVSDAEKIQALRDAVMKERAGMGDDLLQLQAQDQTKAQFEFDKGYKNQMLGLQREEMANALKIAGVKASKEHRPTDAMNLAGTYGKRMEDAVHIVDGLVASGANLTDFASIAEKAKYLPNNVRDPQIRQLLQAQRNFINANLRRESGATISPTEFNEAIAQYFPQWGDDPQTLKNKQFNRARAIEGMRISAGDDVWNKFSANPLAPQMPNAPQAPQQDPEFAEYQELLRKRGS